MMTPNHSYSASLFYRSLVEGTPSDSGLWEESIILIEAPSPQEAEKMALQIGNSRAHSYQTAEGKRIDWVFFKVERIFSIGENRPSGGTELFSRFLKNKEASSILEPFED